MGPPIAPPMLNPHEIRAADGYRLPLRQWLPAGPPRAVMLALHGFNDYSACFETGGPEFARAGIATYAYDQRGFGATEQFGIWPGTETLVADLRSAVGLIRHRWPGLPLYLLGESMGGAVVMTALAQAAPDDPLRRAVDGVVLVAPAVWGRETMNPLYRVTLWLTNSLVPGLALTAPRNLGIRPSDNEDMLRKLGRDPLAIKATRVDAIHGLVDLMDAALAGAGRFDVPGLILVGANDQIIPPGSTERLLERLPPGRQRVATYAQGFHMLLRDLDGAKVVADIVAWTTRPEAPLPSGADRTELAQSGGGR